MRGFVRAAARLVLMVLVMAGVLLTATALGLPTAAVLGLSITVAGLVGMIRLSRREPIRGSNAQAAVAAMRGRPTVVAAAATAAADPDVDPDPVVASMAPDQEIDPESLMPRWRRPSLLAARRADPLRVARTDRPALRFAAHSDAGGERRVVRYAVVALLDRPDEVLGRQLEDLMAGDEIEVLESGGAFWRVMCPNGRIGWVHRTTLGPGADAATFGRRVEAPEPDDLLTAVLSARGIQ